MKIGKSVLCKWVLVVAMFSFASQAQAQTGRRIALGG